MEKPENARRQRRNPLRSIGRWIAFWMVSLSVFTIIGSPSKDKK